MQSVSSIQPRKPSPKTVVHVLVILALVLAAAAVVTLIVVGVAGNSGSPGTASHVRSKHPYYVVQAGDSLSTIAAKEGIEEALIKRLNPNLDPLSLQPENCVDLIPHGCHRLAAPEEPRSTPSSHAPKDPYYVVQAGDSFSSVAAKEGVGLPVITRLNPKLRPAAIQPGDCVNVIRGGCRERAARSSGSAPRSQTVSSSSSAGRSRAFDLREPLGGG